MDWLLEGEWFKNCNCDPGCPCDFNQAPTNANCEGMVAMRIEKGTSTASTSPGSAGRVPSGGPVGWTRATAGCSS